MKRLFLIFTAIIAIAVPRTSAPATAKATMRAASTLRKSFSSTLATAMAGRFLSTTITAYRCP